VSSFRSYMDEMQRGSFALDGGVTTDVLDVAGTPAESFETTARRYAALPFARQTLTRRIAAFARFNAAPFYPGIDPATWERRHDIPQPPHPTLAIDDEHWLGDHRHQMTRQPRRLPGGRPALSVAGGRS
jgi:NAD(P)H dehydrogenase (quinone)